MTTALGGNACLARFWSIQLKRLTSAGWRRAGGELSRSVVDVEKRIVDAAKRVATVKKNGSRCEASLVQTPSQSVPSVAKRRAVAKRGREAWWPGAPIARGALWARTEARNARKFHENPEQLIWDRSRISPITLTMRTI